MKKIILVIILLSGILYAEDCNKYKLKAEKWYTEAQGSFMKESYIKEYNRANFYMSKAIYCQNKKLLKKED